MGDCQFCNDSGAPECFHRDRCGFCWGKPTMCPGCMIATRHGDWHDEVGPSSRGFATYDDWLNDRRFG